MKRRILIVEDNRIARDSLTSLLQKLDYEVQGAASGEDALALLDLYSPDVALLDMQLPGIPGDVLALLLQRNYPHVKIVFVSSEFRLEHPERFTPRIEFVHKPVDFPRLLSTIAD